MKMSKNVCQKKKKGGKEKRGANLQLNNFIVTRRRAHPSQFSRVTWWEQLFNVKRNLNLLFQIRQIALNPAKECASQSCRLSYVGRKNFLNRLSTVVSAAVLRPITNQNEGSQQNRQLNNLSQPVDGSAKVGLILHLPALIGLLAARCSVRILALSPRDALSVKVL